MTSKEGELKWLHHRTKENDVSDLVEDLGEDGKLGQGFSSVDELEEIDIGDAMVPRPMYVNTNLAKAQNELVRCLTRECIDCFAWEYIEIPSLGRDLVEHIAN
jgi:hypothetical protein